MELIWVAVVVSLFFFVPAFFQYLWNMTVPEIFGLRTIQYWQSFRLLLIAGMLFGAGGLIHFNFNR